MRNNSFSLDQREAEIAAMRRSRATDAMRTLMALGDAEIYLSHKAIEALGWRHEAGVAEYLQGKLGCQDINSAVAAVKSLAQVQGEEAIPAIAELLENSRERSDGYQARIWASCADALAQLASARSIGLLNRELRWVSGGSLQLEYGSRLVRAVYVVGRGGGVEPLENYAAALEAKKPAEAMPRKYYEDKIQEARETAAKLKANPRSPD
jgi:HEAT repeat protein